MIVTCQGCDTRFHLADAQVPERGVRVRCSKCHHRFLVKPGDGPADAPPAGGSEPAPQTSPTPHPSESRADASEDGADGDEPDLENPEFLFDPESSAASGILSGTSRPPDQGEGQPRQVEKSAATAAEQPDSSTADESAAPPAGGDSGVDLRRDRGQVYDLGDGDSDAFFGDSEIPTGRQLGEALARLEAQDASESGGGASEGAAMNLSPLEDDPGAEAEEGDTSDPISFGTPGKPILSPGRGLPPELDPDTPVPVIAESEAPPVEVPEPVESMVVQPTAAEVPEPVEPGPAPEIGSTAPLPDSLAARELDGDDLLGSVMDDDDEDDDPLGAWDPLAGLDDVSEGIDSPAPAPAEAARATGEDRQPTRRLEAPSVPPDVPPGLANSKPIDRLLRFAAVAIGVVLVLAGARVAVTHGAGWASQPETVAGPGWVATDINALHRRDATGRRVLVLRGTLLPDPGGEPPEISAILLDASGEQIGAAHRGRLRRIAEGALTPEALSRALGDTEDMPSPAMDRITGFTILIADPAPEAERFKIELSPRAVPTF